MARILPALSLALLVACSGAPTTTEAPAAVAPDVTVTVRDEVISEGEAITFADLSIQGMSCEMMCGGSIKKALAKLPGVVGTEIRFQEGEEQPDHAIVTFDPTVVDQQALVKAVHGLYDGQYRVSTVEVVTQVKHSGASSNNSKGAMEQRSKLGEGRLPSFLALLERLVQL